MTETIEWGPTKEHSDKLSGNKVDYPIVFCLNQSHVEGLNFLFHILRQWAF